MEHLEIIEKIIGPISPVGETNEDERRLENLKNFCTLVNDMVEKIDDVGVYKDRVEFSMNQAGKYADNFMKKTLGIRE